MTRASATHEAFERSEPITGPSDRSFGRTFAVVFTLLGTLAAWRGWDIGPLWFFGVACLFGLVAFVRPALLGPLNKAWLRFGLLLHSVMSPLIMGMIFFLIFTPMGVLMRAFGKDFLRLKKNPGATSYWIVRQPPGPPPESLKNQF
jgi:energy-coupling factor transporter transmembrane protein EcfT